LTAQVICGPLQYGQRLMDLHSLIEDSGLALIVKLVQLAPEP
jgi:hypothetical protein